MAGSNDFRVIVFDRGRCHHHLGVAEIAGIVTDRDANVFEVIRRLRRELGRS